MKQAASTTTSAASCAAPAQSAPIAAVAAQQAAVTVRRRLGSSAIASRETASPSRNKGAPSEVGGPRGVGLAVNRHRRAPARRGRRRPEPVLRGAADRPAGDDDERERDVDGEESAVDRRQPRLRGDGEERAVDEYDQQV